MTTQFDDHTKMRRLLAPAFSPKAVAGLFPRMAEIIGQGLEAWAAKGSIKALEESKLLSFKVGLASLGMLCKDDLTDPYHAWALVAEQAITPTCNLKLGALSNCFCLRASL